VLINGDRWTVVDEAPAAALAEMVAALLEDEGFVAMVRSPGRLTDILSHLGTHSLGTHYVLVPEEAAQAALTLIKDTVTDYQGEDLERFMDTLEGEALGGELEDDLKDDLEDER
jgi:hypothetical protein